jgi:hypothetical protein
MSVIVAHQLHGMEPTTEVPRSVVRRRHRLGVVWESHGAIDVDLRSHKKHLLRRTFPDNRKVVLVRSPSRSRSHCYECDMLDKNAIERRMRGEWDGAILRVAWLFSTE